MVEKRKIEELSQDELNSSKKIKILEEEIVKLKKRDEDAQVMTQNMNEKMMDRIAKAEKGFSYISQAGGAFLEWLKGNESPGVKALKENKIS